MSQSTRPVRIDVTADVVCPWCLIAIRRLDRALAGLGNVSADVVYHPFLVDAEPPRSPDADAPARRRSRYGDPAPLLRRVEAVARGDGIELDLSRVGRSTCTVGAHTLLRHARALGSQRALARALLGAHFLESRDVSSELVLEPLASSHGFAAGAASALLRDPEEAALTREQAAAALDAGVAIAPHIVIGGVTITGAQPVDVYRRAIERASSAG